MYRGYRVMDVHAHAFPDKVAAKAKSFLENYYGIAMYGNGTLSQLCASAREAGVERVAVFSTATRPDQVENINTWIAAAAARNPLLLPFGTLHPDYPMLEGELERIRGLGLRGIKLHPDFQQAAVESEQMQRIYRLCGDLPLLIHMGDTATTLSKPRGLAEMLQKYPHLRVIAAHMGGYSEWEDAIKYLADMPVWVDTSSTMCCKNSREMADLIHAFAPDKVLFATDYPMAGHKAELDAFLEVPLSEEERRNILYNNAAKFFKWEA